MSAQVLYLESARRGLPPSIRWVPEQLLPGWARILIILGVSFALWTGAFLAGFLIAKGFGL